MTERHLKHSCWITTWQLQRAKVRSVLSTCEYLGSGKIKLCRWWVLNQQSSARRDTQQFLLSVAVPPVSVPGLCEHMTLLKQLKLSRIPHSSMAERDGRACHLWQEDRKWRSKWSWSECASIRCQDKLLSSRELCNHKTGKVQPEKKILKLDLHLKGLCTLRTIYVMSYYEAGAPPSILCTENWRTYLL